MKTEVAKKHKIKQQKEQSATLAETLRTSETACIKNRYSRSQNHRSTSCKTMKTEDMMRHKIEQQNEQRATLAETLRTSDCMRQK